MLSVRNLDVFYGQIRALQDVSMEVRKGQIVSMVGANGAGKSTLMMAILQIQKPKRGTVLLEGEPLTGGTHRIVEKGVVLVPERRRLYANLTVEENLWMGAYTRRDKAAIVQDMTRLMDTFPIMRKRIGQYAGTLSGGEQQMVAIARGLLGNPKVLMLDEPSLGLAPMIIEQVFEIIREVRDQGATIFMTEQNAFKALEVSDYAYVLETGRNIMSGTGRELLNDPTVQEAYLGVKHY